MLLGPAAGEHRDHLGRLRLIVAQRRPPSSTLFPYTTLLRSWTAADAASARSRGGGLRRWRWATACVTRTARATTRSEEHTSELQSQSNLVCRLLLEKKKLRNLALSSK